MFFWQKIWLKEKKTFLLNQPINEVYKDCVPWQLNYNDKVIVGFQKANMLEEEMITMAFWTEKGIITSIEIVVGENESWIDRN